jgi:hypothetical protein
VYLAASALPSDLPPAKASCCPQRGELRLSFLLYARPVGVEDMFARECESCVHKFANSSGMGWGRLMKDAYYKCTRYSVCSSITVFFFVAHSCGVV